MDKAQEDCWQIAAEMIRGYGEDAGERVEAIIEAHHEAGEDEALRLWCAVASAVRAILGGHSKTSHARH